MLIDKTKELIRVKPYESILDLSGTPRICVYDYRGAQTSGGTTAAASDKPWPLSLFM